MKNGNPEHRSHGVSNGPPEVRTAGCLANKDGVYSKSRAVSDDDPDVFCVHNPTQSHQQHWTGKCSECVRPGALFRNLSNSHHSLMKRITNDCFQQLLFCDKHFMYEIAIVREKFLIPLRS